MSLFKRYNRYKQHLIDTSLGEPFFDVFDLTHRVREVAICHRTPGRFYEQAVNTRKHLGVIVEQHRRLAEGQRSRVDAAHVIHQVESADIPHIDFVIQVLWDLMREMSGSDPCLAVDECIRLQELARYSFLPRPKARANPDGPE